MKNFLLCFLLAVIALLTLDSCSGTRRLGDDEILYTGTRRVQFNKLPDQGEAWDMAQNTDKKIDAWLSVFVVPNGGTIPLFRLFAIRLFFYNLFYTEKEAGFSHWMMRNFGEPPVTIQTVNPALRVKKIENDLENQGHFGVQGSYEIIPKKGNKKKARIRYAFDIPKAYTYRHKEVVLDSSQQVLTSAFNTYLEKSVLLEGEDFNLENISLEKERLWQYIQNLGYYYIQPDHILILADTTVGNKQLDLQYRLDTSLKKVAYQPLTISQRKITDDSLSASIEESHSIVHVKPKVMQKAVSIPEGELYSLENRKKALRNLSSLSVFTNLTIDYEIDALDSSKATAMVNAHPLDEVVLSLNGDVALKNTGFIGPALGVEMNHKNLFGGAENLTLGLSGYLDFPTGVFRERVSASSGFSVDARLSLPVLNTPFNFITKNVYVMPRRNISLSFERNNRQDYFRLANWKASYGFSWMSSPQWIHRLNILNLNYSHLLSTTPVFDSLIAESRQVAESFQDQFIFGPSYSITFDNSRNTRKRLNSYYQAEVEFSGNILNGMYGLLGDDEGEERKILGVQYSQYFRFLSDLRLYYNFGGRGSLLAFRNIFQIGKAYGNSNYLPFIKQFYVGGSNSLRPLDARITGPGRYIELESAVINQVGDIRIETNLEYRFHLFYRLKGAIWSDFGNIWLHEDDPDRPFSGIRWGKVIEDSYLTAGVGVRLDMDYVVARLDYGAVLYAPLFIDGYRWLWQHQFPLWGPTIGIGYPF